MSPDQSQWPFSLCRLSSIFSERLFVVCPSLYIETGLITIRAVSSFSPHCPRLLQIRRKFNVTHAGSCFAVFVFNCSANCVLRFLFEGEVINFPDFITSLETSDEQIKYHRRRAIHLSNGQEATSLLGELYSICPPLIRRVPLRFLDAY